MAFPITPTDGQGYINSVGTRYVYNAADNKWVIQSQDIGVTGAQGTPGEVGPGATGVININIHSGSSGFVTNGYKGDFRMPCRYKMYNWAIIGDASSWAQLNIYKTDLANYPTGTLVSSGVTGPNLLNQSKNSGTCSGWGSPTGVGDTIMRVEVSGVTGLSHITLMVGYSCI